MEKKERFESLSALIEKAKLRVEKSYGGNKRAWLEAEPSHSYSDSLYKVKVFVLEGSPPKGYVLVDYCYGIVKAFGVRMKHIHTYQVRYSPLCV